MKLQCQILAVNRNIVLTGVNTGRYLKSTLVIGNEPKTEDEQFIMHFSSVNKYGVRYKLNSIQNILTKFINEGKATIQFKEPPHDLYIKDCEVVELKCFMQILKSCQDGDGQAKRLTNLVNLNFTPKDNAPQKLTISQGGQYPNKALPKTLRRLSINDIKLSIIPKEIMQLQRLTVLDLSKNNISVLPEELGDMTLNEINLSSNKLGKREDLNWKWVSRPQIRKTLKLLDISNNKISIVPKSIGNLTKLVTLKLNNNKIQVLPTTIGRMSTLRYLSLSDNHLLTLPGSMLRCPIQDLDVSFNLLHRIPIGVQKRPKPIQSHWDTFVGSLFKISGSAIITHDLEYRTKLPSGMVEILDDVNVCMCGRPTMNEHWVQLCCFLNDHFENVTDRDVTTVDGCNFICYFCSYVCMRRYVNVH